MFDDWQGADGVPVPADRVPVGILRHLRQNPVHGRPPDICGRVRALRIHPWAERVPSHHPGNITLSFVDG